MGTLVVRENLQDAAKVFRSLDFYVVLFGLALCHAWIVLCLTAPFRTEHNSTEWLVLLSGACAMLVVSLVSLQRSKGEGVARVESWFKMLTGILVGVCVATAPLVVAMDGLVLQATFLVVCGIASCCLQVLWGVGFARRQLSFAVYCYPASAVVTALLVAGALADAGIVPLCVFPAASYLLLLVSTSSGYRSEFALDLDESSSAESPSTGSAEGSGQRPLPVPTVVRLLISIAVFSFLCRLYDDLPGSLAIDPLSSIGGSSLAALVVAGVGFLIFAMLVGRSFNPLVGYRVALPLMALGMTIIALFFSHHWYLSVLIIGVGYELFDTLAWILLVMLSQRECRRFAPLTVFALGTTATMLGMGVGRLAGSWLSQTAGLGASEASAMGVIGIMALVVTAFLIIPEGTFAQLAGRKVLGAERLQEMREASSAEGESEGTVSQDGAMPLERACAEVVREYRLTPRESEVLELLARGRTLAIVMRDLGIAKGTAQTHMENIYQKLDVHKQQELIDLVEQYMDGQS